MPFVPAPNIVMVEMRALRNGAHIENRITVDMLAAPTLPAMSDLATLCWDWWELTYAAQLHESVQLVEVVASDLSEENGLQYTYAPDATTFGALTTVGLPNEVALCVSLRSGQRGRSARGRFYTLSVVVGQMLDNNNLTPTAVEAFRSAVATLLASIHASGVEWVIVSYITNNAPRVGGPVYFVVNNITVVDPTVDSMRSRKPGVGT